MFASAALNQASSAYRQIGVETSLADASPHRLIAMLFDGFSDALSQARGALAAGRIEAKGKAIGRATRIVEEGLRGALDLQAGGKLAADLNRLYGHVALRLTHANLHNDDAVLLECGSLIEPVRSAWHEIDPARSRAPR